MVPFRKTLYSVIFLLFTMLLSSCGGSGGGGIGAGGEGGDASNHNSASDSRQNTAQPSNVNGPLRGVLFSTRKGDWLNLETGETGAVYSDYSNPTKIVSVSPDGEEYLEVYVDDPAFGATTSKVVIRDIRTDFILSSFTVNGKISPFLSAKFSPNKQIIALRWDRGLRDRNYRLAFFDREGNLIAIFDNDRVALCEWLSDNEIVYELDDALYRAFISKGDISTTKKIVSLDNIDGWASRLKVSPQKDKIVFEMVTEVPSWLTGSYYRNATLWMVDVNGSDLHLVADTKDSSSNRVNNPVWTLDGKFVLTSAGVFGNVSINWTVPTDHQGYTDWSSAYIDNPWEDIIVTSSPGAIYILPRNIRDLTLLSDREIPVVAYSNNGKIFPYKAIPANLEYEYQLVPYVEPLQEKIGDLSSASGYIYYLKDFSYEREYRHKFTVMRYDVKSKTEEIFFQVDGNNFGKSNYFSVTRDKKYIAHYFFDEFDGAYIYIYDVATKKELKKYQIRSKSTSVLSGYELYSVPTFSPVNPALIMFRRYDRDKKEVRLIVRDWEEDRDKIFPEGFSSVDWAPDGSIIAIRNGYEVIRIPFDVQNKTFKYEETKKLFELPNLAFWVRVSPDGESLIIKMSKHIYRCDIDGKNLTQLTAPAGDSEYTPYWSYDSKFVTFKKSGNRYIITADSENLKIYSQSGKNSKKAIFVTRDSYFPAVWLEN